MRVQTVRSQARNAASGKDEFGLDFYARESEPTRTHSSSDPASWRVATPRNTQNTQPGNIVRSFLAQGVRYVHSTVRLCQPAARRRVPTERIWMVQPYQSRREPPPNGSSTPAILGVAPPRRALDGNIPLRFGRLKSIGWAARPPTMPSTSY